MIHLLASRTSLLVLFVATLLLGAALGWVQSRIDGPLLDMLMTGEAASSRLAELDASQRVTHIWATLVLDTLYPLAYGGLMIGLTARLRDAAAWMTWPATALIVVDLLENALQTVALAGGESVLVLKTIVTPLKFGLFAVAVSIVLYLAGRALGRALANRMGDNGHG